MVEKITDIICGAIVLCIVALGLGVLTCFIYGASEVLAKIF